MIACRLHAGYSSRYPRRLTSASTPIVSQKGSFVTPLEISCRLSCTGSERAGRDGCTMLARDEELMDEPLIDAKSCACLTVHNRHSDRPLAPFHPGLGSDSRDSAGLDL